MEMNQAPLEPLEEEEEDTKRTFIPLQAKIELVMKAERLVRAEKCMSYRAFCRLYEVQPSQLRRWEKNIITMKKTLENTTKKAGKLVCTTGRLSRLEHLRNKLIPWVVTMRKDGKQVSRPAN